MNISKKQKIGENMFKTNYSTKITGKLIAVMIFLVFTNVLAQAIPGLLFFQIPDEEAYSVMASARVAEIVIPETNPGSDTGWPVTHILAWGFQSNDDLISVTISNTVTTIGAGAFFGNNNLTTVVFGNSVETIDNHAFSGCRQLTNVTFPAGLTSIGNNAFANCIAFTELILPNSLRTIGTRAFENNTGLTSILIPDGVVSIGDGAFAGCTEITSVSIPNSVTGMGSQVFFGVEGITDVTLDTRVVGSWFTGLESLENVTLGENVKTIANWAFRECVNLVNVNFPNSLRTIGIYAFAGCISLTNIIIPNSVIVIGEAAFYGATGLTIYAEAEGPSAGWDENWNLLYDDGSTEERILVVWGYENGNGLSVSMSTFSAGVTGANAVSVNWTTASESGIRGFHVFRGEGDFAGAARITPSLISATNTAIATSYQFTDSSVNRGGEYWYWIQSIANDGSVTLHGPMSVKVTSPCMERVVPLFTAVSSVYPNPVRANANFDINVKEGETATLRVFNVRGQIVREFTDIRTGAHNIVWDKRDNSGREVGSGVYFYRFTSQSVDTVQRMVVIR